MTVDDIIKITGQKRGTIEQFRGELIKYRLISNNESLNDRAVNVFKKSINYRYEENLTWSNAMQKAIQEEYGEEMELPFYWTKEIILKDLIWKVKKGIVSVEKTKMFEEDGYDDLNSYAIYGLMIDNFRELGKELDIYKGSFGTDGNDTITYICKGKDYIYYVVGKYNCITKNEDMHIFYSDGLEFNIMKCKHICGGSSDKGRLKDLWMECSSKI